MLLHVENLVTSFQTPRGVLKAVDDVSFDLEEGKTLGLVGESGCGKTVTALSILRLLQQPAGRIESGRILFRGRDILQMAPEDLSQVRGAQISMIFQEPMTSLNPVFTVGDQIIETITLHQKVSRFTARKKCLEMMELVGIPDVASRIDYYPHQMSGGLRQRVMIAMALSCRPQLLIADEPTTALDVTIQAQILDLIRDLQKQMGMSVLMITHDFGVIAETAHHVAVMYAGRLIEYAPATEIFDRPAHPYTVALQKSIPAFVDYHEPLKTIAGIVPNPLDLPRGCRFSDRCEFVEGRCQQGEPALELVASSPGHSAACFYPRKAVS